MFSLVRSTVAKFNASACRGVRTFAQTAKKDTPKAAPPAVKAPSSVGAAKDLVPRRPAWKRPNLYREAFPGMLRTRYPTRGTALSDINFDYTVGRA